MKGACLIESMPSRRVAKEGQISLLLVHSAHGCPAQRVTRAWEVGSVHSPVRQQKDCIYLCYLHVYVAAKLISFLTKFLPGNWQSGVLSKITMSPAISVSTDSS